MSQAKQDFLQEKIEEIINRSRSGQERFFIDFEMAARNIVDYLETGNMLAETEQAIALKYIEQSKAA